MPGSGRRDRRQTTGVVDDATWSTREAGRLVRIGKSRRGTPYGPLDRLLIALQGWRPGAYRCMPMPAYGEPGWRESLRDPERWEAMCPLCRGEWSLLIEEPYRGAEVRLSCANGCPPQWVVQRLARPDLHEIEELRAELERVRATCRRLAEQAVAACSCVQEVIEVSREASA